MDEPKGMKLRISIPKPGLTPEQELKLKNALKSAVVTILPKMAEGQVHVEYKQNEWTEK
jgi:hypothetical protein